MIVSLRWVAGVESKDHTILDLVDACLHHGGNVDYARFLEEFRLLQPSLEHMLAPPLGTPSQVSPPGATTAHEVTPPRVAAPPSPQASNGPDSEAGHLISA